MAGQLLSFLPPSPPALRMLFPRDSVAGPTTATLTVASDSSAELETGGTLDDNSNTSVESEGTPAGLSASLLVLPDEVLLEIVTHLPVCHWLVLAAVCRRLYSVTFQAHGGFRQLDLQRDWEHVSNLVLAVITPHCLHRLTAVSLSWLDMHQVQCCVVFFNLKVHRSFLVQGVSSAAVVEFIETIGPQLEILRMVHFYTLW
jgi:hypothetical protein